MSKDSKYSTKLQFFLRRKLKIKCEYIGGATKDNAFIDGTRFSGRITEKNGKTISLGSRILRTETAAIASVTMCMLYAEMELGENTQ